MKKIKWLLPIIIILIGAYFLMGTTYHPDDYAKQNMASTESIQVIDSDYISFIPKESTTTGIIFYPGGNVTPASYAPITKALAENGYSSFICKMPLNFAILDPNDADEVIEDHPEIENWYIIGHSLGGVMASQYAFENDLKGLILLASYPQNKHDLSQSDIKALSIIGSLDGLISLEKIDSTKALLPHDTTYMVIEGGNHAQMGSYGPQKNDLQATISSEDQLSIIIKAILKLIKS